MARQLRLFRIAFVPALVNLSFYAFSPIISFSEFKFWRHWTSVGAPMYRPWNTSHRKHTNVDVLLIENVSKFILWDVRAPEVDLRCISTFFYVGAAINNHAPWNYALRERLLWWSPLQSNFMNTFCVIKDVKVWLIADQLFKILFRITTQCDSAQVGFAQAGIAPLCSRHDPQIMNIASQKNAKLSSLLKWCENIKNFNTDESVIFFIIRGSWFNCFNACLSCRTVMFPPLTGES